MFYLFVYNKWLILLISPLNLRQKQSYQKVAILADQVVIFLLFFFLADEVSENSTGKISAIITAPG